MPTLTTFRVKLQCTQNTVLGGVSTIRGHSASLGHIDPFRISPKLPILTHFLLNIGFCRKHRGQRKQQQGNQLFH